MNSDAKFRFEVAIGAVLLIGAAAVFLVSAPGLCGNDLVSELRSPSGKWKVVIFERSCGATTGFSTQASVLASTENLGDNSGNVAIPERAWDMKWQTDKQLVVQYSKFYPPTRKTRAVGEVQISYEQLP